MTLDEPNLVPGVDALEESALAMSTVLESNRGGVQRQVTMTVEAADESEARALPKSSSPADLALSSPAFHRSNRCASNWTSSPAGTHRIARASSTSALPDSSRSVAHQRAEGAGRSCDGRRIAEEADHGLDATIRGEGDDVDPGDGDGAVRAIDGPTESGVGVVGIDDRRAGQ